METLSHILASFDIFQVLLQALPHIFLPVAHAFREIFDVLSAMVIKQFATHPGIFSGTIIFLLSYLSWSGISKLSRIKAAVKPLSGK